MFIWCYFNVWWYLFDVMFLKGGENMIKRLFKLLLLFMVMGFVFGLFFLI